MAGVTSWIREEEASALILLTGRPESEETEANSFLEGCLYSDRSIAARYQIKKLFHKQKDKFSKNFGIYMKKVIFMKPQQKKKAKNLNKHKTSCNP